MPFHGKELGFPLLQLIPSLSRCSLIRLWCDQSAYGVSWMSFFAFDLTLYHWVEGQKRQAYRLRILCISIIVDCSVAGGFATSLFGGEVCYCAGIAQFQAFFDRCVLGVMLSFFVIDWSWKVFRWFHRRHLYIVGRSTLDVWISVAWSCNGIVGTCIEDLLRAIH